MQEIIIGTDNGTQSTKVLCYDWKQKKIVAEVQSPHQLISKDDGSKEQKSQWWLEALKDCLEQIPAEIKQNVVALSVSGQQHGFVPIDKHGEVLVDVKLWCDTSTTVECDEIMSAYGDGDLSQGRTKLVQEVGNPILVGYTASKILWFKKNHPDLYAQMSSILLPHNYLNYWLTDSLFSEAGDAQVRGSSIFIPENGIKAFCRPLIASETCPLAFLS